MKSGNSVFIVARNKDLTHDLLKHYNFAFINRGIGGKSLISKLLYFIKASFLFMHYSKLFKPDLFVSFASPYLSAASFFTKIPHLALDDTNTSSITWWSYALFSKNILTPSSFPIKSKTKQLCFPGNFELAYLHPGRFSPDSSVINRLGLQSGESFILVRFVSHNATHDFFRKGLLDNEKFAIVKKLGYYGKVFISSEIELCAELKPYQFPLHPAQMHNALAYASLFYGESATMASEAAVLGVPAVFIDPKGRCYTKEEEEKYELVYRFDPTEEGIVNSLVKSEELLTSPGIHAKWQSRRNRLINDSIDVTAFLIWLIENYPESARILRENMDFLYKFK